MKYIKLIFLPQTNDDNPYIKQLVDQLQKLDIQLERSNSNSLLLSNIILNWKPHIVHLHWLDPLFLVPNKNKFRSFVKSLAFIVQIMILKIINIKIVWTVHNLKNHENSDLFLDRICSVTVVKFADAIITHCKAAKEEVVKAFSIKNQDKVFVVPHGNYIECYENKIEKVIAREKLELKNSGLVFLFLGLIRPYKGVVELIDTFQHLSSNEIQLVIAGKIQEDGSEMTDMLVQKIGNDQRIKLIPGFVPHEQIQMFMNACDIVVFPYRDILTSGAVILAMSFGKACIAPRKGCIGEVLDDAGAFLYEMADEQGLAKAMNSALENHSQLQVMGQHNYQLAEQYSWKHIGEMTSDIYRSCL